MQSNPFPFSRGPQPFSQTLGPPAEQYPEYELCAARWWRCLVLHVHENYFCPITVVISEAFNLGSVLHQTIYPRNFHQKEMQLPVIVGLSISTSSCMIGERPDQ